MTAMMTTTTTTTTTTTIPGIVRAGSDHPAIKLMDWPVADRQAWVRASTQGDLMDEIGLASEWRPASRKSVVGAYGRWLGYLAAQGALVETADPASRITPDRIRAYVAHLRIGRSSVTVATTLGLFSMMVQAMYPAPTKEGWQWLRSVQTRMQRVAVPSRVKRSKIVSTRDLRQLGFDLMAAATPALDDEATQPRQSAAAARTYRNGLMIAALAARPLRVSNFLGTEIGRHLRAEAKGKSYRLTFEIQETKGKRVLDVDWPPTLVAPLQRYLDQVRPILATAVAKGAPPPIVRPSGAFLWLAQGGAPLTHAGLHKQLRRITRARFGHPINAHLFRDCAATTIAIEDPDHVRIAAQVLGHGSLRTTERYYITANGRVAIQNHADTIARLMKQGRRGRRAASKGAG